MPARRIAMLSSLGYLIVHALAASYVIAALWDWRVFQDHWFDHAWELELAYRARIGEWSGRDFHYPRGPLWQLVAYVASGPWGELTPSATLGSIDRLFRLGAIAAVAWIAIRRTADGGRRLAVLWTLAAVSWSAGVPTARALLSAVIVLLYLPPTDAEEPAAWRRPAMVAVAVVIALLLSFDRFGVAGLSLAAMTIVEVVHRWRAREQPIVAIRRAGVTLAAIAVGLLLLSLLGWPFGWAPLDYIEGQRSLASGYATGMRTPWYVGVPPVNVLALMICGAALVVLGVARGWRRRHVVWVAGALPAAVFGVVTSDAGHMLMAILPLICVLVLIAADAQGAPWMRTVGGVLGAIVLVGWLGTYPSAFSIHPRVFAEALDVARGEKLPDRGFVSGHSAAVGVVRELVQTRDPQCVALWPSFTVAHAMAGVPGPTQLALRWSEPQQRELARRIAEADCPLYVHDLGAFDDPGGAWLLGPDFVELVERYEMERRVGPGVVVMRRRADVTPLRRRVVPSERVGQTVEVPLPSEIGIPLGEPVEGEELLALHYRLDMPGWRAQLGGTPWGEWRFERAGEPLQRWQPLHHLRALGEASEVYLSPDPEAFERRWALEQSLTRRRVADTLRVRFRRRGRLTPARVAFTVVGLEALALRGARPPSPTRYCRGEVDLLEQLRARRASPRNTSPRVSEVHFHLDRNEFPFPDAEIFFPIRPCAESCFSGLFAVNGADDVEIEVHVLRAADRPRLVRLPIPANGEEIPIEVELEPFPDEPQWLRVGVPSEDAPAYVTITSPRVGPCSARRWLAEAFDEGRVEVRAGRAVADGHDVLLPDGGARLLFPLRVIDSTCIGLGLSADAPTQGRTSLRVWLDGLAHVLHSEQGTVGPDATGFVYGLHDFVGREVMLDLALLPTTSGTPARVLGPHLYRCVE